MAAIFELLDATRAVLLSNSTVAAHPVAFGQIPRQDKLPGTSLTLIPGTVKKTLRGGDYEKLYRLQAKVCALPDGAYGASQMAEPILDGIVSALGDPAAAQAALNTQLAATGWRVMKVINGPELAPYTDYIGADRDVLVWCFGVTFDFRMTPAA